MEPHESRHIIQNISKLVEFTIVNTTLLANLIQADVITNEVKDDLLELSNPQARSLKLYELLKTRECFSKLRHALEITKQSGALKILNKISKVRDPTTLTKRASYPDNYCIAKNIYKGEMESRIKQYDHVSEDSMKEFHNKAWKETEMLCLETNVLQEHELEIVQQKLYEVFRTTEWHEISDSPPVVSDNVTPTIGIDLGTKNCVVGFYTDTDEKVKIIEFISQKSFASYVSFESNDKFIIGDIAKRCSHENPENTIFDTKRLLGRSKAEIETDTNLKFPFKINFIQKQPVIFARGREYRPEEISALLLKHCKEAAESILKRTVTKAVVTVPAYFNDHQRVATLEAGKKAGLNVLHLLNEPVAAVIAYKQQRVRKFATRVLVFDVGGGTFDVAVIELQEKFIEVKSVGGNAFLGGEDIDNDLANYCLDQFSSKHKKDILDPKKNKYAARNYALLKEACEQVKKDLSSRETSCVSIANFYKGEDLKVLINREIFESLIAPMLREMIEIVKSTLTKGNTRVNDIEDILLVGGTTYIPKLRSELTKLFNGKRMCNDINPDTAVAYGAAVKAAILTSESGRQHFNLQVRDVIPMSIGVEAIVRGRPDIFHKIIPSNSKYPCEYSYTYETSFDYQEIVAINIYQGENRIAKNNTHLGIFELRGIPKRKRGEEEIYVHMAINDLGVLVVTASCSSGSRSLTVQKIMTQ